MIPNYSKKRAAHILFESGLYRAFLRDTAFIVLFHRVDSRLGPDALTCTEEEFEAYCRFLTEYFEVVSLGDLLSILKSGNGLSGEVAITFDDGYRDNWQHARPVLKRYDAPATFFISTGYIGSRRMAPWDQRYSEPSEWMTWSQVRELSEDGFDIGAHTRDHVDLGAIEGALAESQIRASVADIEERLGERPTTFSFPFGRPVNITEANRQIVRREGLDCCLSAFGGAVGNETSPYRLPRMPVSDWYESPYHLGLSMLREAFES